VGRGVPSPSEYGYGERRKLPQRDPGRSLCIFEVRMKPSKTPYSIFLSDGEARDAPKIRGRPKAEVLLSAENRNRNRKWILYGPKPSASLMPARQGPQATVPDADVAASSVIFT